VQPRRASFKEVEQPIVLLRLGFDGEEDTHAIAVAVVPFVGGGLLKGVIPILGTGEAGLARICLRGGDLDGLTQSRAEQL
jgi:hypothetical protein